MLFDGLWRHPGTRSRISLSLNAGYGSAGSEIRRGGGRKRLHVRTRDREQNNPSSVVRPLFSDLRLLHARDIGDIAVRLAADIVLDPQLVMLIVDEARLPIPAVIFRIVNGDDVLELGRRDL